MSNESIVDDEAISKADQYLTYAVGKEEYGVKILRTSTE